ncbi:MAG: DNA replication and repair protein RecF [Trueperaceae bacterium]|nr:DNA replication and repair protein RecF [Trueperaceae bacterium]
MRVRTLRQLHFRNLTTPLLSFERGVTAVVGANAAGKSNLIDALYLGCTGSMPGGTIAEALRFGETGGFVRAELEAGDAVHEVEIGLAPGRKVLRVDGQAVRAADVARLGGAVKVAPEDADLIHGPPAGRRGFLDDLLARLSLRFALVAREYHRVVEQRNALLKRPEAAATLAAWDGRFLELGGEVEAVRGRAVARLAPLAAEAYATIAADGKRLDVALRRAAGEAPLDEALARARAEELARGATSVGPHRDDLDLALDGRSVQAFGSRGEARTASLALRVAEFALLEERHGTPPVLLVDDVSAELDEGRRSFLIDLARRAPQAIVTGTDVPVGADRVWRVADGRVTSGDG